MRHRHNEIAPSEFSCLARPPHALVADAVFLMNFKEAAAMTIACSVPSARARPLISSPPSLEVILNLEIYSDFSVKRHFEGAKETDGRVR